MLYIMQGEEGESQTYLVVLLEVLKFADPAALVAQGRLGHWTTRLSFEIKTLSDS